MSEKLLPCECLGDAICYGDEHLTYFMCRVVCNVCLKRTGNFKTRAKAIDSWNTREYTRAVALRAVEIAQFWTREKDGTFNIEAIVDRAIAETEGE